MKKNVFASVTALVILICLLCGCNESIKTPNLMDEVSANSVERRPPSQPDSASATDFAVRLFKAGNEDGKNTVISPLSVLVALSMTANGAAENTLIQMENVLGMPVEQLNEFIHSYSASLPQGEKYKLNMANSIWVKNDFPVNNSFLQTNADYYGTDIYNAAFDDTTLEDINKWVNQKTEEMIPEILDEIPEDAVMYLINALVFEAEWEEMYGEHSVRENEFTKENGEKQTVQMMYSMESKYISDENAEGFIKYYKDGKYAFAALKPKEGMSVAEYLETLNGEKLNKTLSEAQSISVNAGLPKFETEYDVEMSDILKTMGMTDAFDKNVADFTGISTLKGKDLFIGRVLHKTFISVCEKGTKAGAATAVELMDECAPMYEKTIILDSPFVYMLIDCENNIPFFIGTMMSVDSVPEG